MQRSLDLDIARQDTCNVITARAGVPEAFRLACESAPPAYEVCLVERLFDENAALLASLLADRRSLFITTPTVNRLHGDRLRGALAAGRYDATVEVIACDEVNKTMEKVVEICGRAQNCGLGRKDVLVSFGGGVCSDLVTVAASLVRRGISHVRIPTTLIGQVDAAIGIKGGVNFSSKKNYLGCYHPPEQVLIDPEFLTSLPKVHLSAGCAEIIKMAIIADRGLFDEVWEHGPTLMETGFAEPFAVSRAVVWRTCKLMLDNLLLNFYEDRSYERYVDFGHTFSPLLEAISQYLIPHGQAVAIDIALSSAISCEMGLLTVVDFESILQILERVNLPIAHPGLTVGSCLEAIQDATCHRGGRPNLAVPTSIGSVTFIRDTEDLPANLLRAAMVRIAAYAEAV